jgi:hypothetical protein
MVGWPRSPGLFLVPAGLLASSRRDLGWDRTRSIGIRTTLIASRTAVVAAVVPATGTAVAPAITIPVATEAAAPAVGPAAFAPGPFAAFA